ncbi:hypothetical protein SAMN04487896_3176 [Paenibacillus sp. ov031]|nr:hypothetical protein SAMN04487896_3176 [Paenibacillus sp. ov031]
MEQNKSKSLLPSLWFVYCKAKFLNNCFDYYFVRFTIYPEEGNCCLVGVMKKLNDVLYSPASPSKYPTETSKALAIITTS